MKILLAALAGVAAMAVGTAASAEVYGSAGFSAVNIVSYDLGAVTGRVGWEHSYFGFEGEASVGVTQDDDFTPPPTKVKLKYQAAAYAVARAPIGANFELLGRVGYGVAELENGGFSDTAGGLAYGGGAQYNWGSNGARLDYTHQSFPAGVHASAYTVSYVRKF